MGWCGVCEAEAGETDIEWGRGRSCVRDNANRKRNSVLLHILTSSTPHHRPTHRKDMQASKIVPASHGHRKVINYRICLIEIVIKPTIASV